MWTFYNIIIEDPRPNKSFQDIASDAIEDIEFEEVVDESSDSDKLLETNNNEFKEN